MKKKSKEFVKMKVYEDVSAYNRAVKDAESKIKVIEVGLEWSAKHIDTDRINRQNFITDMVAEFNRQVVLQKGDIVKQEIAVEKLHFLLDIHITELYAIQKQFESIDAKVYIKDEDFVTGVSMEDYTRYTQNEEENDRVIKEILGADLIETDIYTGLGIDETNTRPIRWEKQKVDVVLNGVVVSKTRASIEPQIYPTAKIIGDLSTISGTSLGNPIFVDDATAFHYEKERYSQAGDGNVDALILSGSIGVGAAVTATVSGLGSITALTIGNAGSGYSGNVDIKFSSPVGVGTTATATAVVTNGSVTSTTITNAGAGYTFTNAPQAIIQLPTFQTEKINTIQNVDGYTGIITGIQQTTRSGGKPALRFFFDSVQKNSDGDIINTNADTLQVGYPVLITGTKVGNGLTSINGVNASVVGVGTTFLDNIYIVKTITENGSKGEIVVDVHTNSASSIAGIAQTGFFNQLNIGLTTSLGRLNWGILHSTNLNRSANPISIGVTGLTVDAGLSTFPTIQRKNHVNTSVRGLRSTGAIRAFGL